MYGPKQSNAREYSSKQAEQYRRLAHEINGSINSWIVATDHLSKLISEYFSRPASADVVADLKKYHDQSDAQYEHRWHVKHVNAST